MLLIGAFSRFPANLLLIKLANGGFRQELNQKQKLRATLIAKKVLKI